MRGARVVEWWQRTEQNQVGIGDLLDLGHGPQQLPHATVRERLALQRHQNLLRAAVNPLRVSTPSDGGQSTMITSKSSSTARGRA